MERIGIVRWSRGQLEVISDPGNKYLGEGAADINDAGHIVWKRSLKERPGEHQLFFWDGETIQQITNDNLSNQGVRLNQRGQFVWTRYDFSLSPWVSEILGYFGQTLQRLTNGQRQVQSPHLNDIPQVVWTGPYTGLELWQSGQTQQLLTHNAVGASINNGGDVAVSRWDATNQNYMLWLIRNREPLQLTDGIEGGLEGEVNDRGQVAWNSGLFPSIGVALFTKPPFAADLDFDGDADLQDFSILQTCVNDQVSSIAEVCAISDINNDGGVDLTDLRRFAEWFGGPE